MNGVRSFRWSVRCVFLLLICSFSGGNLVGWAKPDYFVVSSGYMKDDDLINKDDYELVPLEFSWGWELNEWMKKSSLGSRIPGKLDGEIELFLNPVLGPETNVEAIVGISLVWFPFGEGKFSPYVEGGTGPGYTSQHTNEQGSQFNFFSYAGIGCQIKVSDRSAILVGYRIRHFSNAGLDHPNKGVNTEGWIVGMKIRF